MNDIIKETDINNIIGTTFYNDTINASVNELIGILCIEPFRNIDFKTKFEWRLEYYSEILDKQFYFTIYDYKENWKLYIGSETDVDYPCTIKIDWHIGGKSADDTILAKNFLTNKLNEFRKQNQSFAQYL